MSALQKRHHVKGPRINAKLENIDSWLTLAQQSGWSVSGLAELCGVSTDTLRRHFVSMAGMSPRLWLAQERQKQAMALLQEGSSVKETAAYLGYRQQTNFTRKFKRYWSLRPSDQKEHSQHSSL